MPKYVSRKKIIDDNYRLIRTTTRAMRTCLWKNFCQIFDALIPEFETFVHENTRDNMYRLSLETRIIEIRLIGRRIGPQKLSKSPKLPNRKFGSRGQSDV